MRALSVRDLARTIGRRSVRLPLAVALIGILALSAGMVYAAIPNSATGVINGCFEKYTGLMRVIDVEAGKSCTRWETPISWSQVGPAGEIGPQGPQGERGLDGDPGQAGADGGAGADGAPGPQGEQGAQGPMGPEGLQGERGEQGPEGDPGLNGPSGATGAPGPAGPAGPIGDTGAGVVWRGDFETGPGVAGYTVGSLVRYAGSIWIAPVAIDGGCRFMGGGVVTCPPRPGAEGSAWQLFAEDGSVGPQGAVGATGPQGPTGATGATGPQGPAGPEGPQGLAGGLSGWQTVDSGLITVPARGGMVGLAQCPAGKVPLGGGFSTGSPSLHIMQSEPRNGGWFVYGVNLTESSTLDFRAFAICGGES